MFTQRFSPKSTLRFCMKQPMFSQCKGCLRVTIHKEPWFLRYCVRFMKPL